MPNVFITDPPDGALLNYDKKITIRWESEPQGLIKSWKLYLGTEDACWDLLMCERGTLKHIDLNPHDLPLGGQLFAQVRGVYDGKGRNDEDMDEYVVSNIVQWICPDQAQAPNSHQATAQ
jgi:hypothetical protein